MPIIFSELPNTVRVPIIGVEVDPTRARQGPAAKVYRVLLAGMRLASGSVLEHVLKQGITGADQAAAWFGTGSMLHHMAQLYFGNSTLVATDAIAVDADPTGTAATFTVTVTGTATAAGSIYLWIAGRRIKVGVASGAVQNAIAASIEAACDADPTLPVTAGSATNVVTLTANHKGAYGSAIDVRLDYGSGEELPAGVTVVVASAVAGANDPAIGDAAFWAALGDTQYDVIIAGFGDSTDVAAFEAELDLRWGTTQDNDGRVVLGARGSQGTLSTLGNARNSKHSLIIGADLSPTPPWEWASAFGAVAARELQADPGRQLKTLELKGVRAPAVADRFTFAERNLLLYDGISTFTVDGAGAVRIERAITTYQLNAVAQADDAFLDVMSVATLSYIRYDLRARFGAKYPRHKLGDDGTNFGAGQPVMTPKLAVAECVAAFRDYEELGLVENFDQFAADVLAERDPVDRNRLNILFPPDLINNLMVVGVKLAFIL